MRTNWTGVGTALATPFTRAGDLDAAAVRRLGRRQIDAGVHFLVPCGTTGENPTLTLAERLRIVEILADEAKGAVPILAGAGGYDTKEVVHLAGEMQKAGAAGLLSVTPYYNKPTPEGLFQHFRAIAGSSPLPIVLYNVPGRTGVNIDVKTLVRLAAIPNIVGVKEASGNMTQMCEVCDAVPSDFVVLSGDDVLTLPLMAVGRRISRPRRRTRSLCAPARGVVGRHGARGRARSVEPDRLARQHVGEARHSAGLQIRPDRRRVDGSRPVAVLRQRHAAIEAMVG